MQRAFVTRHTVQKPTNTIRAIIIIVPNMRINSALIIKFLDWTIQQTRAPCSGTRAINEQNYFRIRATAAAAVLLSLCHRCHSVAHQPDSGGTFRWTDGGIVYTLQNILGRDGGRWSASVASRIDAYVRQLMLMI